MALHQNDEHVAGTTGAKRATWRAVNPRQLLREIIDKNPDADEKTLRQKMRRAVAADADLQRAMFEYWYDNNRRSLSLQTTHADQNEARNREITRVKADMKVALTDRIHREAEIILLDWLMPNGRRLGQCTGTECVAFGGWLTVIGQKAGRRKISTVFSEGEIRKLWLNFKE